MTELTAIVIEPSYVIRAGWVQALRSFEEIRYVYDFTDPEECWPLLEKYHPDLILFNLKDMHDRAGIHLPGKEIGRVYWIDISHPRGEDLDDTTWADEQLSPLLPQSEIRERLGKCLHEITGDSSGSIQKELSDREVLVLQLVSQGLTNKEIGEKLFISPHTVITHRKNITRKLGIKTVAGLTVYAILNKLVTLQDIS